MDKLDLILDACEEFDRRWNEEHSCDSSFMRDQFHDEIVRERKAFVVEYIREYYEDAMSRER